MHARKLDDNVFLIDLGPADHSFIASYVLKGELTALIETGPASAVDKLLKGLEELGVNEEEISFVMVSHVHIDHAGGAGALLRRLSNAKLFVHQRGAPHLEDPRKLWTLAKQALGDVADLYGEPEPVPKGRITHATDGLRIDLGRGLTIKVVETLGHASHHMSYYEGGSRTIFPGDAAGVYLSVPNATIPTTPPIFFIDEALSSLDKLIALEPVRLCYTHFGQADGAVERLKAYKDQIRLWASIVRESMERGQSVEEIAEKIVERDPLVRKAMDYLGVHPILNRRRLPLEVLGFVEYLKRRSP